MEIGLDQQVSTAQKGNITVRLIHQTAFVLRNIIKKIMAVIFLLLGMAFALYFMIRLPRTIRLASGAFSGETYDLGYFTGTVIYFAIHLTITFFLFRFAIRWLRASSPKAADEVLDGHLKDNIEV